MEKFYVLMVTTLLILLSPSGLFAQTEIPSGSDAAPVDELSAETVSEDEAEEDPRLKLIINY